MTTTPTTIEQWLCDLQASGIEVLLQNGRVHVRVSDKPLADELRQLLRERRDEIRDYLLAVESEATIMSEPATFVSEIDALASELAKLPCSFVALDLVTTGQQDTSPERVIALGLGVPGRTAILDLRRYPSLSTDEQAAWHEALQRLLQQRHLTLVGLNLKASWLLLFHQFSVRLDPVYDILLVEQVLSDQDSGQRASPALSEIAAHYQDVVPANERTQLALNGEEYSWFVALDQRPADWTAPFPRQQVRALVQTVAVLSRVATLQQVALQRQSLEKTVQLENDFLLAYVAIKARGAVAEPQVQSTAETGALPRYYQAAPGHLLLKVDLACFQELDPAQRTRLLKVVLVILYDVLSPLGAQTIRAVHSEIIVECPLEKVAEATSLLQDALLENYQSSHKGASIPMPEVHVAPSWQKGSG